MMRAVSRAFAGWRFLPSLIPIAAIGLLIGLLTGSPQTAEAACTSFAPASGTTDNCDGANTTGVLASGSTTVTLNVLTGGSITPSSGPSIWLGADADIQLQGGSIVGNDAIDDTYAILMGDSSVVTLNGTIQSQGGIAGLDSPTWSGFSNAMITVGSTGRILTSGAGFNAALYGRGGNNVYQIDGELTASGTSGAGIAVGDGDEITLGATGKITLNGEGYDAIAGFGQTGVTVVMDAGSAIDITDTDTDFGGGGGIVLGDNANVTVAGTINTATAFDGGVGIAVGKDSTVWLKQGGQIFTDNLGAPGIDTWQYGPSNSTVIVDGLVDAQLDDGVHGGIGDHITVGSTGKITAHDSGRGIDVLGITSPGNDTVTIDVAGRVEALGTGSAIYLLGDKPGPDITQMHANVTIEQGGSLFAQSAPAYAELDGCCSYPVVMANLVVAGTVARGDSGVAIALNDGADTITLLPTYSITGGIDGGTNTYLPQENDTFALDGPSGTTGAFDFDANTVTNFEAGVKKGAGTWMLSGTAGSGINGTFDVQAGKLSVNGTMTSTDFAVETGATLGGGGTIKSFTTSGTIAPGNSIGTLHVGTAAFDAGSIYEVEINPTTSDLVDATGAVTIDSTAQVRVLPAAGVYTSASPYTIIQSATLVKGTFGGIIDNSAFLDFTLDYGTANQVLLHVTTVADFASVAQTPNQKAAAGGAQALGAGNGVYDAIVPLDATTAQAAFDLLSGEIDASTKGALLDQSRFIREATLGRLGDRLDPALFQSAPLAYAEPTARPAMPPWPSATGAGGGFSAWGQVFGSNATLSGDGNAAGLDRQIGGFFAGGDWTGDTGWRFGVATGVDGATIDEPARASTASVNGTHLAAYAGFDGGAFTVRAGAAVAWQDIATRRDVAFPGFTDTLTAAYGARTAQVFGEVARPVRLGDAKLEPFAGAAWVGVDVDGFSEQGGAAALSAPASHASTTLTTLGLRYVRPLNLGGTSARLTGAIAWQHAFGGLAPTSDLAFAGGTPFTIAGTPRAADVLKLDLGLDAALGPRTVGRLSYSGAIGSGLQDHALTGRVTVGF